MTFDCNLCFLRLWPTRTALVRPAAFPWLPFRGPPVEARVDPLDPRRVGASFADLFILLSPLIYYVSRLAPVGFEILGTRVPHPELLFG